MFERFSDRARRVVVDAQEEARLLGHSYIGTEHLLLGLLHAGEGVAFDVLAELGLGLDAARREVESVVGRGKKESPSGHIPFTPRAKKTLELALREALDIGHHYIGTEHILLGLVREGDGVAAQVLVTSGADLELLRQKVLGRLEAGEGEGGGEADTGGEPLAAAAVAARRVRGLARAAVPEGALRLGEALNLLGGVTRRLDAIESRLAAIEGLLGSPGEPGKPGGSGEGEADSAG